MDVVVFRGVKAHEIRHLIESTLGREPLMIQAEAEDISVVDEVGPRKLLEGARNPGLRPDTNSDDSSGSTRPVNVQVNVVNNASGGGDGRSQNRGARNGDGKALAAIRKKTDLIPGLVEKVDATPGRTAALVKKAVFRGQKSAVRGQRDGGATDCAEIRGSGVSARLRAKRSDAGRRRAVVYDVRDRKAIRAEVRRVQGLGLSQAEACRQVAEQAENGRAGTHALTMKYNLPAVTGAIVRRVFLARR